MIKIPKDLQSHISASYRVNSLKIAVEELIHNALDAGSLSIAVRVNAIENSVQVVDNGYGIKQSDFELLGLKYTTSKFVNISVLKSISQCYGYRGLSLASIIEVSHDVRIESRSKDTQTTLSKRFLKGECKEIRETTCRPSQGTTVDIRGLLYNLKIQREALDNTQELLAIKILLQQFSLVHANVSFSLRDDLKNEILFQIHKNRDIMQTLKTLFEISPNEVQELKVEKSTYKVHAFIGRNETELKKCHWTKFAEEVVNTELPTYFLFITCPLSDYDTHFDTNSIVIEFKNWDQITNILEKLVQCYTGNIKLNSITKPNQYGGKKDTGDQREEVKRIIHKILQKPQKKQNVPMYNAIRGKQIKRKRTNSKDKLKIIRSSSNDIESIKSRSNSNKITEKLLITKPKNITNKHVHNEDKSIQRNKDFEYNYGPEISELNANLISTNNPEPLIKDSLPHYSVYENAEKVHEEEIAQIHEPNEKQYIYTDHFTPHTSNVPDLTLYKFQKMRHKFMKFMTECQPCYYKSAITENTTISKQNILEQDLQSNYHINKNYSNEFISEKNNKPIVTSYDLIQTVIDDTNINLCVQSNHKRRYPSLLEYPKQLQQGVSDLTYESHHYGLNRYKNKVDEKKRLGKYRHFISEGYRESLLSRSKENKTKYQCIKQKINTKTNKNFMLNTLKSIFNRSRYTKQDIKNKPRSPATYFAPPEASKNFYSNSIDETFCRFNTMVNSVLEDDIRMANFGATYTINNVVSMYDGSSIQAKSNTEYQFSYSVQTSKIYYTEIGNLQKVNQKQSSSIHKHIEKNEEVVRAYVNDKDCTRSKNILKDEDILERHVDTETVCANKVFDPLNICETIYSASKPDEHLSVKSNERHDIADENVISHHFNTEEINKVFLDTFRSPIQNNETMTNINDLNSSKLVPNFENDFIIKSRYAFVPKGISPIFNNCGRKTIKERKVNLDEECYKDAIYENFAELVCDNAEIFEPKIQNVYEAATNDINKATERIKKDNADLLFDTQSIKNAQVLGQVDCKFIAAILSGKAVTSNTHSYYLVLFDQHAVHERIRLELSLSDYINGAIWKSVNVDSISFKLSREDAIFLHNYKEKLTKFGLEWTVIDNGICVNGIPEAILGKSPRQVEVVLKATKNLFTELIHALKTLKGNIPLYPKSIMDLVFSEACRYAIMFGDSLSKSECTGLIESLGSCKTPFQCAHGRPVMAVMMELAENKLKYKVVYFLALFVGVSKC
ncbi:unnamed protein product [Leptosia nina]|uniref:MutL C-terminal dimerisation domain-containing protein n=1 Tax=Leptosia nina TaxID=320188 RepID=A0AAV1J3P1_9NEOP